MCGIAGYLNLDGVPASSGIVRRMAAMLEHRGPDDAGHYTDGPIGLGHQRLSILDLSSAGHQPMATADGRYVMIYNGEIYNFQDLRLKLQALGHQFVSQSDAEVLLYGFAVWQEKVLDHLNGMFSFAIWDRKERRLFLARDRFGIKPLYWAHIGNALLFGSEIKAFFPFPDYSVELDEEGLVEYFTFQNFFTNKTLFKHVEMFPAGSYCWVSSDVVTGSLPEPVEYWDYRFREPTLVSSREEYLEELDRLFVQAVQRQLVSDVEVGAYLSGGMDSGSIVAIASQQIDNLKSFTVGFDTHSASGLELAFDEREKAEYMSYHFGTEHYEMVLKSGDMERCMRHLAWHLEEPRVGQSHPNFYAAKLAGSFCKVALSGAGGDELFGGYPWRYYRTVVNDNFSQYVDKYFDYWKRLLPPEKAAAFFSPLRQAQQSVDLKAIFSSVFKDHTDHLVLPQDYVNHSLYFEAKTFLHGLLTVEDKLSMAHSLETRVPFLDNDLVDFAQTVPVNMKLGNLGDVVALNENEPGRKTMIYFNKTRDGKLLLREAMQKYIPEDITRNVKQGFSAPDASWFKGDSIAYVKRRLMGKNAALFDYIDRGTVHELVNDHLEGHQNRRLLIWSLLSIEEWMEMFLVNSPTDPETSPRFRRRP